jgi:hypothetical protein
VLGDMNVACLLEGKTREVQAPPETALRDADAQPEPS